MWDRFKYVVTLDENGMLLFKDDTSNVIHSFGMDLRSGALVYTRVQVLPDELVRGINALAADFQCSITFLR
jgi:hypothetical protein